MTPRDKVRSCDICKAKDIDPVLLRIERQSDASYEEVRTCDQIVPGNRRLASFYTPTGTVADQDLAFVGGSNLGGRQNIQYETLFNI